MLTKWLATERPLNLFYPSSTDFQRPFPPKSGRRDTKPLLASVQIHVPLSVKPVTGACDLKFAEGPDT
jgi:hypothetical protein